MSDHSRSSIGGDRGENINSGSYFLNAEQALQLLLQDCQNEPTRICKMLHLPSKILVIENEHSINMPGAFSLADQYPLEPPSMLESFATRLLRYLNIIVGSIDLRRPPAHIHQLPEEILRDVFLKIPEIDTFGNIGLVLTQVCRHWRRIAYDVSELWTRLELTSATQPIHNLFYALFHYLYHTNNFTLTISSPLMISTIMIFKSTITPCLQHRLSITHLHTIVLNGQGAIDALDSIFICCDNLRSLSMFDIQTRFPLIFFQGLSGIQLVNLSLSFCLETMDAPGRADFMLCRILCRCLTIVWNAKWMESWILQHIRFLSVEQFAYKYVPSQSRIHGGLEARGLSPLRILNTNQTLLEVQLTCISVSSVPRQFSKYLINADKLVFVDVEARGFFSALAEDHEVEYFPSLTSLILVHTLFEIEELIAFVHRITTKGSTQLAYIGLEGILIDVEENLDELHALGHTFGINIEIIDS